MVVPPILDVFVIWHPDDLDGEHVYDWLSDHFRSPAYAGLAGGAVEVYARSAGWTAPYAAPRPLGIDPAFERLPAAQFNAIVPVLGVHLARAVQNDEEWRAFFADLIRLHGVGGTSVFPLRIPKTNNSGLLAQLTGPLQALPLESIRSAATLGRELSQAITQRVGASVDSTSRIKVFVSHTKHFSAAEQGPDQGEAIFQHVRNEIANSRLADFFDAQDLQSGSRWEDELDSNASRCAMLMVRTDKYSGREWTQREVLIAKRSGVPIVGLYAFSSGEDRGSFVMDHVASVPCNVDQPHSGIRAALNRLVDEVLKRALWTAQTLYLETDGFDWLPVHAPEPITLAPWLADHKRERPNDDHVWIIHPDPPLGPKEREVVVELCELAGFSQNVDVLTPRTFAARGGVISS